MFVCNSYKKELLSGLHSIFHNYFIALFDDKIKINKLITSYYDLKNEIPDGNGYLIGGQLLQNIQIFLEDDIAILDFQTNPKWENSTITAKGALIYNNSLPDKNSVAVINFKENYSSDYGDFIIEFPEPNKEMALIRIC